MGIALALFSALCFGVADFLGGLLSRRADSGSVALVGQVAGGVVLLLAVAPLVTATHVSLPSLGWGALSGVGTGVGVLFLYRGLTRGKMSVVVPLSTVGGVALSVLAGVVFFGDRPSLLVVVGTVVAVPALWLVSRSTRGTRTAPPAAGAVDGLLSGVGFALQNIALPHADAEAGLWPVAVSRVASVLAILPLAKLTAPAAPLSRRLALGAAGNGVIAAAAIALYLLATRQELLTVAVVLSSLYPVIPVLLGLAVLHERLAWPQAAGLVGAGLAVTLLSVG